ncbi:MAG: YhjD/YihY/BrkB family envelope integrity protein [Alphaproteobacteria bacterium]|nr:YhjD/YihY/BrkB family envelope integrity protein [Alphaproteobacteria bacterium]
MPFHFFYWLCMLLFLFYCISFVYSFAPNVREKWKMISYGSIIATSEILLFSFWVKNYAQYDKVYGSIGGLMILFFLIYLNAYFLLVGFEINVSIYSLKQSQNHKNE